MIRVSVDTVQPAPKQKKYRGDRALDRSTGPAIILLHARRDAIRAIDDIRQFLNVNAVLTSSRPSRCACGPRGGQENDP